MSSFCTCVMEEDLYSYCTVSTDETPSKPSSSGSHHDRVLGSQKCTNLMPSIPLCFDDEFN
jgi:hypothetical protein